MAGYIPWFGKKRERLSLHEQARARWRQGPIVFALPRSGR